LLSIGAFLFAQVQEGGSLTCKYTIGSSWLFTEIGEGGKKPILLEENSTLKPGDSLHTKEQTLCEIENKCFHLRIGSNSIVETDINTITITRGSTLLYLKNPAEITIKSKLSTLFTKGEYTAIIDSTSNGGFKFIPLEGKGEIIPEQGEAKNIYRGRLTMVLGSPSKLGNAYDIDLLLLLKSSRLINSFPTPLPSMKRISLSIYAQQLRMKGKYNALIGDAPTDDNLQMWAFGEDDNKE